jgi:uncharacterized membrane protein
MKIVSAILLSITLVMLTACGGGTTQVQQQTETQGQELLDLKEALDQGAITQKEYDKAKARILKSR